MTEDRLRLIWAKRDARYAMRKNDLTPEMVNSVQWWRLEEAIAINSRAMMEEADKWTPPIRITA